MHETEHDTIVIAWGGSYVSLLAIKSHDALDIHHITSEPLECSDWIFDASIQLLDPDLYQYRACLVTAHNALLSISFSSRHSDTIPLSCVHITDASTCLLYSARLVYLDQSTALVAAGTIFGDIEFWSVDLADSSTVRNTHYVLSGHDGSVFGVDISEPVFICEGGALVRLIASCSDDRTTRIWAIPANRLAWPQHATGDTRETGFGVAPVTTQLGHNGARCVARAWGHLSRIWSVQFVQARVSANNLPMIVTCGEDATAIIWQLTTDLTADTDITDLELKSLHRSAQHRGKHIWSSATTLTEGSGLVMATGGADGAIACLQTALPIQSAESRTVAWHFPTVHGVSQARHEAARVRSYAFLSPTDVIVVTDSGHVYDVDTTRPACTPRAIGHVEALRGFSLAVGVPHLDTVLVADRQGTVYSVTGSTISPRDEVHDMGKPAAIFARNYGSASASLVTFVNQEKALVCLEIPKGSSIAIQLVLAQGFVTTSFAIAAWPHSHSVVFLGGRDGTVLIFLISNDTAHMARLIVEHKTVMKDAVTDLAVVRHDRSAEAYLVLSGRDGSVAMYRIIGNAHPMDLQLCHHLASSNMTVMEQLALSTSRNALVACGFRSKHFVMQDLVSNAELLRIDCGGANRTWAFQCAPTMDSGLFAWTRASQLCTQTPSSIRHSLLQTGGHGREIKAVAIAPVFCGQGQLVATGAEDTDIAISRLQYSADGEVCLHSIAWLHKHNTGVQQLKWSEDARFLFSSGGIEELFAWKVQSVPLLDVGVYLDSACPTESDEPDLRVMDFTVRTKPSETPEQDAFVISTVRSDSTILVYSYVSQGRDTIWTRLYSSSYRSCCLTTCLDMPLTFGQGMLVTATDGHGVWMDTSNPEPRELARMSTRFRVHQSAIHCADLCRLNSRDSIYISGGDDNAMGVTRLMCAEADEHLQTWTLVMPRAHTSAITAVRVLHETVGTEGTTCTLAVATAGLDHRVKVWVISIDLALSGIEAIVGVRMAQDEYTAVADVSSMATTEIRGHKTIVVCGVGTAMYRVKTLSETARADVPS